MTETLCTSGAVKLKAGANVSTAITGDNYTDLINQAESYIVCLTRTDYVSTYSGLTASKKKILEDAASSHAAISAINYDMSNFTSRQEALIMINILWAKIDQCIKLLNDDNTRGYLNS